MKNVANKLRFFEAGLLYLVMAVFSFSCISNKNKAKMNPERTIGGSTNRDVNSQVATALQIKDLQPRTPVRNFREINRTYSALTGIPISQVQQVYERLKTSLPSSSNLTALSGATINGSKELAANYCDLMSRDEGIRSTIFPGINFTLVPAEAYANSEEIAGQVLDQFWGTNLESLPDRNQSIQVLSSLIKDLVVGNPGLDKTPGVLMGACMAVLSSTPILLK